MIDDNNILRDMRRRNVMDNINEILKHRLGTHIEYYWDGKEALRRTILNDGDIKITGSAYLSVRRTYSNERMTEMKTAWIYRPTGGHTNTVKVAQKLAHSMIMESDRQTRR